MRSRSQARLLDLVSKTLECPQFSYLKANDKVRKCHFFHIRR